MYYLPERDGDLLNWANNVKLKLPTLGATLGLSTGDINNGVALANDLIAKLQAVAVKEDEKKAAVAAKNASKKNAGGALASLFARAKTMPAYTEAIGMELGIVAHAQAPDTDGFKTKLTVTLRPDHIEIKFTKKGTEGVNIYTRLKGDSAWTLLARSTYSPYRDTRPLRVTGTMETREYCAYGLMRDQEIGERSDIVSIFYEA